MFNVIKTKLLLTDIIEMKEDVKFIKKNAITKHLLTNIFFCGFLFMIEKIPLFRRNNFFKSFFIGKFSEIDLFIEKFLKALSKN